MFAYLIKSRLIHPDIVNDFVEKKLLYENNKKSCVFVGVDKESKPRYANIRSTNTIGNSFKGDASLSDKRFGFAKAATGNTLTIVEAPIDLLSYMTIYKIHGLSHMIENEHILSLGGVSDVALFQYLKDHPEIEVIRMGLDNDEVGNKACEEIFKKYSVAYEVQRITFQQKDFNEVLKADIQKLNQKREMEKAQESSSVQADEYETA
nr:DUF3991 and TOPRIM domain-containing protein [Anaerocolumna cellulosilytica]